MNIGRLSANSPQGSRAIGRFRWGPFPNPNRGYACAKLGENSDTRATIWELGENAQSFASIRVQKGDIVGNPPIAHGFHWVDGNRSIPMEPPLRELIAAKDSPNLEEFRRLGFPAPQMWGNSVAEFGGGF